MTERSPNQIAAIEELIQSDCGRHEDPSSIYDIHGAVASKFSTVSLDQLTPILENMLANGKIYRHLGLGDALTDEWSWKWKEEYGPKMTRPKPAAQLVDPPKGKK